MSKSFINFVLIIIGSIFLFYLANQLVSEKKVPSLTDLMASSTAELASSTTEFASSTGIFSSSTNEFASSTKVVQNSTSTVSTHANRVAFDFPATTLFNSKGGIKVFIAKNDADREQGLSDIKELPKAVGALFVFDKPGKYGFWMKDMNFPIDLIWIDANKNIVGVTKNALPKSYPFTFMPPSDVLYVLEMNAGSVSTFSLITGTKVNFILP